MTARSFFLTCLAIVLIAGAFAIGYIQGVDVGQKWPTDGIGQMTDDVEANAVLIANLTDRLTYLEDFFSISGKASWYGHFEHGRTTANGDRFYRRKFTCAVVWPLPLNRMYRVTDTTTGRWVDVYANDRLPAKWGRIVDLAEGAAIELGIVRDGVVGVRLEAGL